MNKKESLGSTFALVSSLDCIGKSVKVLDKVGARTSALKALKALKKLVQLRSHTSKIEAASSS
jgi:hypothetical protein